MRFAAAVFCLLAGSLLYAQETLPGQDLIGSDRSLHRGDAGNRNCYQPGRERADRRLCGQHQRRGHRARDSNDRHRQPHESAKCVRSGTKQRGWSDGEPPPTAEIAAQRGGTGGDNGSVWNANAVRKSNIVGVTGGESQKQAAGGSKQ